MEIVVAVQLVPLISLGWNISKFIIDKCLDKKQEHKYLTELINNSLHKCTEHIDQCMKNQAESYLKAAFMDLKHALLFLGNGGSLKAACSLEELQRQLSSHKDEATNLIDSAYKNANLSFNNANLDLDGRIGALEILLFCMIIKHGDNVSLMLQRMRIFVRDFWLNNGEKIHEQTMEYKTVLKDHIESLQKSLQKIDSDSPVQRLKKYFRLNKRKKIIKEIEVCKTELTRTLTELSVRRLDSHHFPICVQRLKSLYDAITNVLWDIPFLESDACPNALAIWEFQKIFYNLEDKTKKNNWVSQFVLLPAPIPFGPGKAPGLRHVADIQLKGDATDICGLPHGLVAITFPTRGIEIFCPVKKQTLKSNKEIDYFKLAYNAISCTIIAWSPSHTAEFDLQLKELSNAANPVKNCKPSAIELSSTYRGLTFLYIKGRGIWMWENKKNKKYAWYMCNMHEKKNAWCEILLKNRPPNDGRMEIRDNIFDAREPDILIGSAFLCIKTETVKDSMQYVITSNGVCVRERQIAITFPQKKKLNRYCIPKHSRYESAESPNFNWTIDKYKWGKSYELKGIEDIITIPSSTEIFPHDKFDDCEYNSIILLDDRWHIFKICLEEEIICIGSSTRFENETHNYALPITKWMSKESFRKAELRQGFLYIFLSESRIIVGTYSP